MKKTLSIVLLVLLVFLAVACSPEHKHDYQLVESKTVKATCESGGYDYLECSCGAIQSMPTAALGHDYVEDKDQYKAPTCVAKGKKVEYCSRCGAEKVTPLSMNANNHPFFGGSDGGSDEDEEYNGLYNNIETATFSVWPTCSSDGKATFTHCSACGKDIQFETVVPKEIYFRNGKGGTLAVNKHVRLAENASEYTSGSDIEKAVISVAANDIAKYIVKTPATAFATGTEANVCPTCNKEMSNSELTYHTIEIDEDAILGNWVYSDVNSTDETTYHKVWLEVRKRNGYYFPTKYTMKSAAGVIENDKTIVEYTSFSFWNLSSTNVTSLVLKGSDTAGTYLDLSHVAVIITEEGISGKVLAMTQAKKALEGLFKEGDYVVLRLKAVDTTGTGDGKFTWTGVALDVDDTWTKTAYTISYKNHIHSLGVMSDVRAITGDSHYMACDCGLKYVKVDHGSSCEVCGYKSDSWFDVSLTCGTVEDEYALPMGSYVTVPKGKTAGTKYVNFFGSEASYISVISSDGASSSSTLTTYYWDEKTSEGITLVLEELT